MMTPSMIAIEMLEMNPGFSSNGVIRGRYCAIFSPYLAEAGMLDARARALSFAGLTPRSVMQIALAAT